MIWSYLFHDGTWFGTEETRLRYDDFDLADGMAYDRFGLDFGRASGQPGDPAGEPAAFTYDGIVREVTGPGAGGFVPVALDLSATPTTEVYGTGTGNDLGSEQYPASRFEQSMAVAGTVRIGDETRSVRAAGHRDRSWGPRNWRVTFTLGDLQSENAPALLRGRAAACGARRWVPPRRVGCATGALHRRHRRLRRRGPDHRARAAEVRDRRRRRARRGARARVAEHQLRHGPHLRGARALALLAHPRRCARVGLVGNAAAGWKPTVTASPDWHVTRRLPRLHPEARWVLLRDGEGSFSTAHPLRRRR